MENIERIESAIEFAIKSDFYAYQYVNKIWERLKSTQNICIFGTGKYFIDLREKGFLRNIPNIKFVCDNNQNKWGKYFETNCEAKCISPKELNNLPNVIVLIAIGDFRKIKLQLTNMKIENYPIGDLFRLVYDLHYDKKWFITNRSKIIEAYSIFEDERSKEIYTEVLCNRIAPHLASKIFDELKLENEYFNTDIFKVLDNECIVDCGAYNGDSLDDFYKISNGKFDAYYCFELDPLNCKVIEKKIASYDNNNIKLIKAGVSDKNEIISISTTGNQGTNVFQGINNNALAELVRIDDVLSNKRVTYIKMDVEGSELMAMRGAKNIIRTQKPKLAISSYHYLADLWNIPFYIKELNSNYKVYLRHHTTAVWDTDCYAII